MAFCAMPDIRTIRYAHFLGLLRPPYCRVTATIPVRPTAPEPFVECFHRLKTKSQKGSLLHSGLRKISRLAPLRGSGSKVPQRVVTVSGFMAVVNSILVTPLAQAMVAQCCHPRHHPRTERTCNQEPVPCVLSGNEMLPAVRGLLGDVRQLP